MAHVLEFEAFPSQPLHCLLFRDVANAKEIKRQVTAGEIPTDFAFLDAAVVPDLFPLHLSAFKALLAQQQGKLLTKNIHSELVVNLSGSKHISDSLRRFGIGNDSKHIIAARFAATSEDVAVIQQLVIGEQVPVEALSTLTDHHLLQKYYKVSKEELQVGTMTDAIVCRIAGREAER